MSLNRPYIVITGNPADGFTYLGPFPTEEEAIEFASDSSDLLGWWVTDLEPVVHGDRIVVTVLQRPGTEGTEYVLRTPDGQERSIHETGNDFGTLANIIDDAFDDAVAAPGDGLVHLADNFDYLSLTGTACGLPLGHALVELIVTLDGDAPRRRVTCRNCLEKATG